MGGVQTKVKAMNKSDGVVWEDTRTSVILHHQVSRYADSSLLFRVVFGLGCMLVILHIKHYTDAVTGCFRDACWEIWMGWIIIIAIVIYNKDGRTAQPCSKS